MILACVLAAPAALPAQGTAAPAAPAGAPLFTSRDGAVAAGALAASALLSVFDKRIARFFLDTSLAHVRLGNRLDHTFTHANETTLTAAGILAYGVGRLTRSSTFTDVAFHATEAIVGASLSAQVVRGPIGRSRPGVTGFQDQYDFHWFRGFTSFDYRAFPSIHSGSAFAVATVLVAETARRRPAANWIVAPIAYGLALTPGLSRMYLGKHWASDIASGAAVGTLVGLKVVRYSHAHPGNRLDRTFLPRRATAVGDGGR